MTQAELCRQKAIECEEEAKRTPSPFEAEAWLKLAKQWPSWRPGLNDTLERLKPAEQS
jgi:hypothetical protein